MANYVPFVVSPAVTDVSADVPSTAPGASSAVSLPWSPCYALKYNGHYFKLNWLVFAAQTNVRAHLLFEKLRSGCYFINKVNGWIEYLM